VRRAHAGCAWGLMLSERLSQPRSHVHSHRVTKLYLKYGIPIRNTALVGILFYATFSAGHRTVGKVG
jgi:hypothetical protein